MRLLYSSHYYATTNIFSPKILLDLLLISRHMSPGSINKTTKPNDVNKTGESNEPPLASAVLDTLLCIMVDSPPALRIFEVSGGIEMVVKLLRRAGIVREVR